VTPAELAVAIRRILEQMQADGSLVAAELPAEIVVERPRNREHGDWATNAAMQLSGLFGLNPRAFAELLAPRIEALDEVSKVDIAGPGFINITLNLASAGALAKAIVEAGSNYGTSTTSMTTESRSTVLLDPYWLVPKACQHQRMDTAVNT